MEQRPHRLAKDPPPPAQLWVNKHSQAEVSAAVKYYLEHEKQGKVKLEGFDTRKVTDAATREERERTKKDRERARKERHRLRAAEEEKERERRRLEREKKEKRRKRGESESLHDMEVIDVA